MTSRAQDAQLREALAPFAKIAAEIDGLDETVRVIAPEVGVKDIDLYPVPVGDLRRARAALSSDAETPEPFVAPPKPADACCTDCSVDAPYPTTVRAGGVLCTGCGRSRPNVEYVRVAAQSVKETPEP